MIRSLIQKAKEVFTRSAKANAPKHTVHLHPSVASAHAGTNIVAESGFGTSRHSRQKLGHKAKAVAKRRAKNKVARKSRKHN